MWSRGGSFGWKKIGDTAFLVCLVSQKPGRPVPQQSPARKALTARCWLEGVLGKAVEKGAGREPTPLPGP